MKRWDGLGLETAELRTPAQGSRLGEEGLSESTCLWTWPWPRRKTTTCIATQFCEFTAACTPSEIRFLPKVRAQAPGGRAQSPGSALPRLRASRRRGRTGSDRAFSHAVGPARAGRMRTRRLRPLGRSHVAARKRGCRKRELFPYTGPRAGQKTAT